MGQARQRNNLDHDMTSEPLGFTEYFEIDSSQTILFSQQADQGEILLEIVPKSTWNFLLALEKEVSLP